VSPVKYEVGFYIPEDDILHSHRRENVNSYKVSTELFPSNGCSTVACFQDCYSGMIYMSQYRRLESGGAVCSACELSYGGTEL
jgi:hypothetical protein